MIVARKQALSERQERIAHRLAELSAARAGQSLGTSGVERVELAFRHVQSAQNAERQARASYLEALRNAAQAHERAGEAHQRAADSGWGDSGGHLREVTFHRQAAEADWRRAEQVAADIELALGG